MSDDCDFGSLAVWDAKKRSPGFLIRRLGDRDRAKWQSGAGCHWRASSLASVLDVGVGLKSLAAQGRCH